MCSIFVLPLSRSPSCNAEKKRKSENFPIAALLSYQEIATFVCCRSNVQIEETNPRCNIENGFPILRLLSSSAYLTDQENNVDFSNILEKFHIRLDVALALIELSDIPLRTFVQCKRDGLHVHVSQIATYDSRFISRFVFRLDL